MLSNVFIKKLIIISILTYDTHNSLLKNALIKLQFAFIEVSK